MLVTTIVFIEECGKMNKLTSSFSSPEEQKVVIAQWRDKTKLSDKRVEGLNNRVQLLVEEREKSLLSRKWIDDLEALNREQKACEVRLASSKISFDGAFEYEDTRESIRRLLSQLKHELKKSSQNILSLEAKNVIVKFHHFLSSQMVLAETEEEISKGSSSRIFNPLTGLQSVDAIFSHAYAEIIKGNTPLSEPFFKALALEKEETMVQLQNLNEATVSSDPKILLAAQALIERVCGSTKRDYMLKHKHFLENLLRKQFPNESSKLVKLAVEEAFNQLSTSAIIRTILHHLKEVVDNLVTSHNLLVASQEKAVELESITCSDKLSAEEKKRILHEKLEQQRRIYDQQQREKNKKLQLEKAKHERKDALERKRQLEEFHSRLRLLEEYANKKKEYQEKEKELQLIRNQREDEERLKRMKENGKRVLFRQQLLFERQKECERHEIELAEIKKKKEMAIQRFFESMEKKIGIEPGFSRILQSTQSSEHTQGYTPLNEATSVNIWGYTDEQIMKDPRVRLYHALLGAGLHKSAYGREKVVEGYRLPPAMRTSDGNPFEKIN